jgi:biotin carboxyl carrier protein
MSKIQITIDDTPFEAEVQLDQNHRGRASVVINGETLQVEFPHGPGDAVLWALVGGNSYEIVVDRQLHSIRSSRGLHRIGLHDLQTSVARPSSGDGRVKAPIPGTIVRVLVSEGQAVEVGQPLLVLEAMKMENQIRAPRSGNVGQLNVAAGQSVTLGLVMAEIV